MRLPLGEMVSAGVVHGVGSLPAEVGHQKEGVQDVADGVLDGAVVGEGVVAALVRDDPARGSFLHTRSRL